MRIAINRKRVVDFVVYVLIGLAMVGAVILYAEIGPFAWMPSVRWWGLAGLTALLGLQTARTFRRSWRRRSFWLWLTGLVGVHLLAWAMVLRSAAEWGLLWFVPPTIIEAALFVLALNKLGFDVG